MDEIPDCANAIVQFLGEGQGFANQPPDPQAQRVVDALNTVGLAALLPDRTMVFGRQDADLGFPQVAIIDRTLSVDGGQGCP